MSDRSEAGTDAPPDDSDGAHIRTSDGNDIAAGSSLGRYVVLHPLGAGGMSVVYAAFDPEVDRIVAVLGEIALDGGDAAGAMQHLSRAQEIVQASEEPAASKAAVTFVVARAEWATGHRERAHALAREARAAMTSPREVAEVDAWLASRTKR